ncbi:MAG TPA: MXAN_5187 C-terminal domain-containing protein [Haliangiales bacterium]|nr:MXAN_5187 C-terminal domain-containing protein [Haliangiales bacterium]
MAIDRGKKPGEGDEVDIEELIGELEKKLERLKILYEQFFMGIEKMEPMVIRKEITRRMLDLSQINIRNTAQRYRFGALHQKFGVYTNYWSRTLREIERGTYFRNVVKVARDAARRGVEAPDEVLRSLPARVRERILRDREVAAAQADRARAPTKPPGPAAALGHAPVEDPESFEKTFDSLFDSMLKKPAPAEAPAVIPGMDEERTRELYRRFVEAKRLLGQPTDGLKYEHIVATLQKQAPKIMKDHKARTVEFTVVVKDGKVILKANPKK